MPTISIVVRLQHASQRELDSLVTHLDQQSFSNWELILVSGLLDTSTRLLAADKAAAHPKVRAEVVDDKETVHTAADSLWASLGTWVTFMGILDRLDPGALATCVAAADSNPQARVIYTNEESFNRHGVVSLRFDKGAINPMRLRHQEYLRDLALIRVDWLSMTRLNRMATDYPLHDFYMRTFDALGPSAFHNVPIRLFKRHRNHADRKVGKDRRDILNGFDMLGIREHLDRNQVPAIVRRRGGTVEIAHRLQHKPWVTLFVVNDGSALMQEALRTADSHFIYRPLNIKALPAGADLVERLNLEITHCDTPLACVLQGLPVNPDWLDELVAHSIGNDVAAVSGRLINPIQLTEPGMINYRFEGWDWNSRGRFNEIAVPHQVSACSPHALLLNVDRFTAAGGFNPGFPTLYGMDLTTRLDQAGHINITVPRSIVHVMPSAPSPEEAAAFQLAWPGWSCRFGLHFPT